MSKQKNAVCQQRDRVLNYLESLTIQKVRIPPRMSQMSKTLCALRVAMSQRPHLIVTILCWKAITLHLHLKERLYLRLKGAGWNLILEMIAPQLNRNSNHTWTSRLLTWTYNYLVGDLSSPPSVRTLGAFVWHVPCRLLRRDGESSLYNIWGLAHYRRWKSFDGTIWGDE